MLTKIFIILGIIIVGLLLVAIYSCFILSGKISELERKKEINRKVKQ